MTPITDQEFTESKLSQEAVYKDEMKRPKGVTYLDPLGHARWDTDYLTLRLRDGYGHAAACQEVRCRIREASTPPLPALEPHPPVPNAPPVPPVVTPPPAGDVPGVFDDMERFATHYARLCGSTGFAPDQRSTRETRVAFLQRAVLDYRAVTVGLGAPFVLKRADIGRPIGDDVVVFTVPGDDYRRFWDFIPNAGAPNWKISVTGPGEILDREQLLVDPVTLEVIPED